jgi:N,N-dimethylformamidase beta subunit-like protein
MQTLRHKSQLYILIIFIFMIAIVIIAPVNHRPVLPISANNRKVSLKPSIVNVPSSFWVVQRSRKEGSGGVGNLTKSSLVLSNFENNNNHSFASILNKSIDIALVAPTFTVAAYDNNSFYAFYKLHANIPAGRNVTSNLDFLSRKLTNQDTTRASLAMLRLIDNLKLISPYSHVTILSDPDVDNGSLFNKNGKNIYTLAILGHQEYVTQEEYSNLKQFVRNGGTMILLDGNVFFAQVKYDRHSQTMSLVKGHWWAYNGRSAWPSIGERWADETSEWIGSNYLCYQCVSVFGNDPFEYRPHEEQYITNHNDTIVLNYNAVSNKIIDNKPTIATYELNYRRGKVVAFGIFSDDVITNSKFDNFFDNLLVKYVSRSGV